MGMRNWHPFLADTLRVMRADGVRHAIGFIAAAQHSYSSCQQSRENVVAARAELRERTERRGRDLRAQLVRSPRIHRRRTQPTSATRAAVFRPPCRAPPRLVCTAHSIPLAMAERSRYREQLALSARLVAEKAGMTDWALVFQSRSGRPEDPWLEPDICDTCGAERASGLVSAVLCLDRPCATTSRCCTIFDYEAAQVSDGIGLPMTRAAAVNDDNPQFIDMMTDVVLQTIRSEILRGTTQGCGEERPLRTSSFGWFGCSMTPRGHFQERRLSSSRPRPLRAFASPRSRAEPVRAPARPFNDPMARRITQLRRDQPVKIRSGQRHGVAGERRQQDQDGGDGAQQSGLPILGPIVKEPQAQQVDRDRNRHGGAGADAPTLA